MGASSIELTAPKQTAGFVADIRLRALQDANRLRALAWSARDDGMPKADLRAANARAAARRVLAHARRLSDLARHQVAEAAEAV